MTAVVRAVVAVGVVALVGLAGFAIFRAIVPDYGQVNARTLGASVTRESGGSGFVSLSPCHRRHGAWICDVDDTTGSGGGATYRVTMRDEHCWRATKSPRESDGRTLPMHSAGCVLAEDKDAAEAARSD